LKVTIFVAIATRVDVS